MSQRTIEPLVSIIIPVYNGANYLKEAIESALAQTYKNIEIIVVNDGSNDNGATENIAKSYGSTIRYFSKKNGGVSTALNLGITKMRGEYFSWLSHDDRYKPSKIESQIAFLSSLNKRKVVLYSDYEIINEDGELQHTCKLDHNMLEKTPIYSLLRGSINGITLLIPREAFIEHGDFDESLRCSQDYDMWLRIQTSYEFIHLPEILSQTRVHSLQDTVSNPAATDEGNTLWIRMVKGLPDKEKIRAEGSLFNFYIEMVKFLENTPYNIARKYCMEQLESIASNRHLEGVAGHKVSIVKTNFEYLCSSGQKIAAAEYISCAIKERQRSNSSEAVELIEKCLVGYVGAELSIKALSGKKGKARLMFCSGYWLTGGMERVLSIIFEQLKDDFQIYLLTPFDGRKGKISLPKYVHHITMTSGQFENKFDVIALAWARIIRIDVVIGFLNLFEKQLKLYELCHDSGVKTIASNHEVYFYPYRNVRHYELIESRIAAFKKADAVLWPTNFSAAAYGLLANNSYLMPNPNTFDVKDEQHEPNNTILCVGRFTDYVKRVDRALLCFSIVSKNIPESRLVLVGKYEKNTPFLPGDNRTIEQFMADYHIDPKKVDFVGEVSDVSKYYSKASVLLLTSNSEGFGMVINEATCHGVPIVCTNIPGIEDLVVDNKNGFIVEQNDIHSMSGAVEKLLRDRELRDKMGRFAKDYVSRFDKKEVGDAWKYLVNTLIVSARDSRNVSVQIREKLDYSITDYHKFSSILMKEMGLMVDNVLRGPLQEDISRLLDENKELRQTNNKLGDQLYKILESKRWKVTSRAIELANPRNIRGKK